MNRVLTNLLVALLGPVLTSCASTHDMASGPNPLGGGIREFDVADGVYRIMVKTNAAPWENLSGARSSWLSRAEHFCGQGRFKEFEVREYSYDNVPAVGFVRYIVTAREGYAVCNRLKISDEEALGIIRKSRE